jgi:hypothetical protein
MPPSDVTQKRLPERVDSNRVLSMQKLLPLALLCWFGSACAIEETQDLYRHPVYAGAVGGWGSTTWQGLVPKSPSLDSAMAVSAPIAVKEGGLVWGATLGYEFSPYFALEADYMSFPNASVIFDEYSLYAYDQNDTMLFTQTQTVSLNAKVMLIIPKTKLRLFSSAGVASVFRNDLLNNEYRISPTFGFGFNTVLTERLMVEIGTNYTAGYGESEINPVLDYVPFLYSAFAKVMLRFC